VEPKGGGGDAAATAMECIAPARPAKLRSTPHRRSALVMSEILNEYNANTALVYV